MSENRVFLINMYFIWSKKGLKIKSYTKNSYSGGYKS